MNKVQNWLNNKVKKINQGKNKNREALELLRNLGFPLPSVRRGLVVMNDISIKRLAEGNGISSVALYAALKTHRANGHGRGKAILADALGLEVEEMFAPVE